MKTREQNNQEELEAFRKRKTKQRSWLKTCSLFLLFGVIGVIIWILWMLAATGLVQIPVFSSIAYERPEPIREVTAGVPVQVSVQDQVQTSLRDQLYNSVRQGTSFDSVLSVSLTEESLTSSFRSYMEQTGLPWIDSSHVQMVVDEQEGIQVFMPLLLDGKEGDTAVTAYIDVDVLEGEVLLSVRDVSIGSTSIPRLVIVYFVQPYVESELARITASMVGYSSISALEVLSGQIIVTGDAAVQVQP